MKRFINVRHSFSVEKDGYIEDALEFIRTTLTGIGIAPKQAAKTELISEEMIVQFVQHAAEGALLYIQVKRFLGDINVIISMKGGQFDPYGEEDIDEKGDLEYLESEDMIRSILLKSYGDKFKYSHKNNTNSARIQTKKSEHSTLIFTLAAMVFGLLFGVLAKTVFPEVLSDGVCTYMLSPVKTMFMNALKIVIAPVVFFSIVTCFSQFTDISEFGRMGAKVMGMYILTTIIAVLLSIGVFYLIQPGEFGFALSGGIEQTEVSVDTDVDTSILHTIVNIVPSNFVQPFLESDTLQIIFLAVICGIAVGMIGEYSSILKDIFEACNSLFLTITTMIARLIPLAVFCSVALLVVDLGGDSLLTVAGAGLTQILAIICMLITYGLLVFLLGRLNPIRFFMNIKEGMLTSFTLCSSSAAMPTNLKICTDKLGIAPKVCNFSIPLGATVNMDGTCIYLTVLGLFLVRAYGVAVTPQALASVAVTIILLSLGAPGVPGSALVCLGVVLKTFDVPVEAMGLIMAISPILDMFDTTSNTTGDMAASLIVARSEKLVDTDVYYGNK